MPRTDNPHHSSNQETAVKFIITAAIALLLPTVALADPDCNKTRWPIVDTTIPFGMSADAAVAAAKKKHGTKATVVKNEMAVIVSFLDKHQDIFDNIVYVTKRGVVTRIIFSYSNSFQASLGGLGPTMVAMSKKMIAKVGEKADDFKSGGGEFSARWNTDNGASMEIWGKDPNTAVVRFVCETLEDSITKSMTESTNFGF